VDIRGTSEGFFKLKKPRTELIRTGWEGGKFMELRVVGDEEEGEEEQGGIEAVRDGVSVLVDLIQLRLVQILLVVNLHQQSQHVVHRLSHRAHSLFQ